MKRSTTPEIEVRMGSDSDLQKVIPAYEVLEEFEISYDLSSPDKPYGGIISAHRTPRFMQRTACNLEQKKFSVCIAAAGGAAHLPGMTAANTPLPVIGIPISPTNTDGLDSLLSIIQMPYGIPVGCVGIDQAAQAALIAAQIISLSSIEQRAKIRTYRNIDASAIQPAWKNKIGLLVPAGIELPEKKYSDFETLLSRFGITVEKKEIPAVNDTTHLKTVNYFETEGVRALVVLNDCDIPFVAREISALTDLPVIGVLLSSKKVASAPLEQYPLARMLCYYEGEQPEIQPPPRGYPVLGVAINGLQNAALLAARIIGVQDTEVRSHVKIHLEEIAEEVREKNVLFHALGWNDYAKQMKK